jgi:hypothetical protein
VLPSTIASTTSGVLLRLSFACYLNVSSSDVLLTSVTSSAVDIDSASIAYDAPVNAPSSANCTAVVLSEATQNVSTSPPASAVKTTVALVVRACDEARASGVAARLAVLAAAHPNASWAVFGAFLNDVAHGAGLSSGSLSAVVAVGPSSAVRSAVGREPASSGLANLEGPNIGLVLGVSIGAALAVLLCCFVAFFCMRRRPQPKQASAAAPVESGVVSGMNPMHAHLKGHATPSRLTGDAATSAAVRASAAPSSTPATSVDPIRPAVLVPPSIDLLPWRQNHLFRSASDVDKTLGASPTSIGSSRRVYSPRVALAPAAKPAASPVLSGDLHVVADSFRAANPLRSARASRQGPGESPSRASRSPLVKPSSPLKSPAVASSALTSSHDNPLRMSRGSGSSPSVVTASPFFKARSGGASPMQRRPRDFTMTSSPLRSQLSPSSPGSEPRAGHPDAFELDSNPLRSPALRAGKSFNDLRSTAASHPDGEFSVTSPMHRARFGSRVSSFGSLV